MTTSMTMTGVALLIAKSSLLLAFGWCVSRLLHRASASARHLVWLTVIVGVLLLPAVGALAPVPVRVLPAEPVPALPTAGIITPLDRAPVAASPMVTLPSDAVAASTPPSPMLPRISLTSVLVLGWSIGAFVLLLRLVVGIFAVNRLAQRGRRLDTADWTTVLEEAARRLGVRVLPSLIMSDQVEMAFAFHPTSPIIVVPGSAREWSRDRRRAVLLHELAHIQRRDLVSHAVAGLVCALTWFNPFIWAAARQLRIESEMASDEIVLRAGIRPSVYAQHLLDMVTSFGRRAPSVALAMARPKEFEGRLVAILDSQRHRPLLAGRRGALVAFAGLPALALGAVAPMPRAAAVAQRVIQTVTPVVHADAPVADMTPAPKALPPVRRVARTEETRALSSGGLAMLLRFGTSGVVNPMMMLLRDADSLNLTSAQADSIATLNRSYMIRLNRIWAPVSSFYVSRADTAPLAPPPGSDPTRATLQALVAVVRDADGLLTAEQRKNLPSTIAPYLDPRAVNALVGASPNGVFMSLDQLYSVRGRGRGGG